MIEKLKTYIPTALVFLAVAAIAVVGHRHWLKPTPQVIVEQVLDETAKYKPQPNPKKQPKTKPKKKPKTKPAPERPEVVPVPTQYPYRVCDETGWCWTYF
jgi:outer membrane biosynthesis protein TonB